METLINHKGRFKGCLILGRGYIISHLDVWGLLYSIIGPTDFLIWSQALYTTLISSRVQMLLQMDVR